MVTKKHLRAFCEKEFGPVEAVQIIWDYNTGLSKGYGFVHFVNIDDAAKVKSLGTVKFYGRDMDVGDAVLSDRRNKLCKYFFDKGRCMKPNCAYAHSLGALRNEPGVEMPATDDAVKYGAKDAPPMFPRASTYTYGDSHGWLRELNWAPSVPGDERAMAERAAMAKRVPPPQVGPPQSHQELGPRLAAVDGQYSIVIPLSTLVHRPDLVPLLQLCSNVRNSRPGALDGSSSFEGKPDEA